VGGQELGRVVLAPQGFHAGLRVIDSLQLTDHYKVVTTVNWESGEDVIVAPALQDPVALKRRFPKGYKTLKPCLRLTPQPNL
jgi:hypothetical protein